MVEPDSSPPQGPKQPPDHTGWLRRFSFRLIAVYLSLFSLSWMEEMLAGMESTGGPWSKLWQAIVPWVGRVVMGLKQPVSYVQNGSGDKTFDWVLTWCFLVAAFVGAFVWVWFDRQRKRDAFIHEVLRVVVRYFLAFTMVTYGVGKINHGQFPFPDAARLMQPYGESSPMGLLWTFMGYSGAYSAFTGLVETTGGLLLLFRRTTALGALVVAAAMINVVVLNFCYDVPVKLFSTHLLLFTLFLLAPDLRRLVYAFFLNRPTSAMPLSRTWPARWMARTAAVLKVLAVGSLLYLSTIGMWLEMARYRESMPKLELNGLYEVESFSRGGQTIPPLLTDGARWRTIAFRRFGVTVRNMDNTTLFYRAKKDSPQNALALETPGTNSQSFVLTYTRPEPDQLRIEGEIDGQALTMQLRRVDEKKFLLVNRGFHWINEVPFNR